MNCPRFFIIFILAIAAVDATSNIKCVVSAFNKEITETSEAQHKELLREQEIKKQEEEESRLQYGGDSIFKYVYKKAKSFVGFKDPEIAAISYHDMNKDFLKMNRVFLSSPIRKWVKEQCVPYVDSEFNYLPKSVYICSLFVTEEPAMAKRLMELKMVAHRSIGNKFIDSAKEANTHKTIESMKSTFATTEGEFKTGEKYITNYYTTLWQEFHERMMERCSFFWFEKNYEYSDNKNLLTSALKEMIPENLDNKDDITQKIWLGLKKTQLYMSEENVTVIIKALNNFRKAIVMDMQSESFPSFIDTLLNDAFLQEKDVALLENVVLPFCLNKIAILGTIEGHSQLSLCQQIVEAIHIVNAKHNRFGYYALMNPKMKEALLEAIEERIVRVAEHKQRDVWNMVSKTKSTWEYLIDSMQMSYTMTKHLFEKITHGEHVKIAIFFSFVDIVTNGSVETENVLTDDFFILFKEVLEGNIFDSDQVFDFIQNERTEILRKLGQIGIQIKTGDFIFRLSSQCKLTKTQAAFEVCVMAGQKTDLLKVLHYRHHRFIYNLYIQRFEREVAAINIIHSDTFDLAKTVTSGINDSLMGLEDEVSTFIQENPEFANIYTHKQITMFLIVAKAAFNNTRQRLPTYLYSIITEWGGLHSEVLRNTDVKHRQFGILMENLFGQIKLSIEEYEATNDDFDSDEEEETTSEFELDKSSKKQIKKNLKILFENYAQFPKTLKGKLTECILPFEEIDLKTSNCNHKAGRLCHTLNPFMIGLPCPHGHTLDSEGRCLADCPQSFHVESNAFCKKPQIELITMVVQGGSPTFKCQNGQVQEGLLCIPKCPTHWRDVGEACQRPSIPMNRENSILLIN